ncbi:MAG: chemotaxis protein CheW, partial [Methanobacteriota archaeon]
MSRYTCFQINGIYFGIELNYVQEIIQIPKITKLPNTFPYILGIFSLRGEFLPLFDIGYIMGLEKTELGEESKCIIIKDELFSYGIISTELLKLVEVDENNLKADQMGVPPNAKRFVKGYIREGEVKIFLIDIEKLSVSEEL